MLQLSKNLEKFGTREKIGVWVGGKRFCLEKVFSFVWFVKGENKVIPCMENTYLEDGQHFPSQRNTTFSFRICLPFALLSSVIYAFILSFLSSFSCEEANIGNLFTIVIFPEIFDFHKILFSTETVFFHSTKYSVIDYPRGGILVTYSS